uniref:Uncharacterized protein n=1 Tax=Ciona savignyi TaxID=51511 RepID=H2ZB95_CIOSA
GNESEEEEIEREDTKCVEPIETKPTKRKFTEEYEPPPVKISKVVAEIHSIAKPTPPPTPQVDTPIQPPILTQAPQASTFTAVTPSGEAASISTLRQKQAARRHKALLFLNAKKLQQTKENPSKETPEVEILNLASAASEDIFDLSETSSPASRVDSPTTSTSEIMEGEAPARKRTSRFDILPKNITSSGTVPAVVPVVSTLSVETKSSPRDSGRVPRTDDEIPSAYREENESARGRREPDKRRLSSRLNSQRHKHRHHRNRHKSDDDYAPSKHRSRRKY